MKNFLIHLFESKEAHHVLAFGRMNPPTVGHEALVQKTMNLADKIHSGHTVVGSGSQDPKKNPLDAETKLKHLLRAFPEAHIKVASKKAPTILHHAANLFKRGIQHLHVVAGSDRKDEMHTLLHKYNDGKEYDHGSYKFKTINVHSSGERDPDAEGTAGMSASKMRAHAAAGNKEHFVSGAPSAMSDKHREELYHDVRRGMGLK